MSILARYIESFSLLSTSLITTRTFTLLYTMLIL